MSSDTKVIGGNVRYRRYAYLHKRDRNKFGLLEATCYKDARKWLGSCFYIRTTWLSQEEADNERERKWEIVSSIFLMPQSVGFIGEKAMTARTQVQIRWMIRRDMPSVLAIEEESFEFPWSEEEFIRVLRQRECIGMVAEVGEEIAGFMIYELHKNRIHILSFAVHPYFRRERVGTVMVEKLVSKLTYQRRERIVLDVREKNVTAQLFFRQLGFRAVRILKSYYDDTDEDAYLMEYRIFDDCVGH